jgi:branched-chain amino acid transport system permease protein
VFVTILAGTGSVGAAFIGSLIFEAVRSVAVNVMPGTWQMILGGVLLLTILFLPEGIGSLVTRRAAPRAQTP